MLRGEKENGLTSKQQEVAEVSHGKVEAIEQRGRRVTINPRLGRRMRKMLSLLGG